MFNMAFVKVDFTSDSVLILLAGISKTKLRHLTLSLGFYEIGMAYYLVDRELHVYKTSFYDGERQFKSCPDISRKQQRGITRLLLAVQQVCSCM